MYHNGRIYIGTTADDYDVCIFPKMANRHGLIAGATGTGKTTTLKTIAESFSEAGVPVFMADAKGDLSGIASDYPVNFWDVYGQTGITLRTTISEMGPLLLGRVLDLTDLQCDVLTVVFKIADDNDLLLIDTKDLKAMLSFVGEHASDFAAEYGNIAKASLNVITRAVVALEAEGGDMFFGEPALNIKDWLCTNNNGLGMIQLLDCRTLMNNPKMYSTFVLWMMSELFETLPEAGDLDKPRLVFFIDEAHMLFSDASKALVQKVEQVVKLIRSKGVGLYFVTQNPADIPNGILAQLGNKVQHALRAYTPAEQKGCKAACQSFRENPDFNTYDVLINLGIGEALVSVLDEEGIPTVVEKTKIHMAQSYNGPLEDSKRDRIINNSNLFIKYQDYFDRDSAYERLMKAKEENQIEQERIAAENAAAKAAEKEAKELEKMTAKENAAKAREELKAQREKKNSMTKVAKSVARTTGGTVGRSVGKAIGSSFGDFGKTMGGNIGAELGRSILGTFFK